MNVLNSFKIPEELAFLILDLERETSEPLPAAAASSKVNKPRLATNIAKKDEKRKEFDLHHHHQKGKVSHKILFFKRR